VDVNYIVFIEVKEAGKVEQLQETHRMYNLFFPEVEKDLRGCGFQLIISQAWMTDCPLVYEHWGGFDVASRDWMQQP
jgi:hypothetical protein